MLQCECCTKVTAQPDQHLTQSRILFKELCRVIGHMEIYLCNEIVILQNTIVYMLSVPTLSLSIGRYF